MCAKPLRAARHVLDGSASCIAEARRYADAFLSAAVPAVDDVMIAHARLATSELVTNAVRHAPGPCALELRDDGRRVEVAVSDSSTNPPVDRHHRFEDGEGGAGLLMLRQMAGAVDVRLRPDGKTVSIMLDRESRPWAQ